VRVLFTGEAKRNLIQIAANIARDAPKRARSFSKELRAKCLRLGENPFSGSARPDVKPNPRILPHGRYVIYCESSEQEVLILCIYHSARLIEADDLID
jgi:plasmid stabilization system protein ParE